MKPIEPWKPAKQGKIEQPEFEKVLKREKSEE